MKTIISGTDRYLLRFDRGEELMSSFKKWAEEFGMDKLKAAHFSMLGAADKVVVAAYNLKEQKYHDTVLTGDLEIINVSGNLTWKKDDSGKFGVIVHGHGTFGGEKCQVWGGHVKEMHISITCEVSVIVMNGEGEAVREFDPSCGVILIK